MTDMIERVGKAIFVAAGGNPENYILLKTDGQQRYARAAIAAMRNCTPAMLDAGSAAHPAGGYVRGTLLTDIIEAEWVAMCDAALEEKS
jgi:hypothetical protein